MMISDEAALLAVTLSIAILSFTLAMLRHQEAVSILYMGIAVVAYVSAVLLVFGRKLEERMEADE